MKFKNFLKDIQEETVSGDIATVDTKIGSKPLRHQGKTGKKCRAHKRVGCLDCQRD